MTATAIQPAKVYALVVGIEKYQAGSAYDLNGPANDALNFSSWLLDQGVEPEHIYLFLSPLEQNQGVRTAAEARGLTPAPATHDRITSTIRSRLTNESSRGELLYVFWGGHGIITKTDATVRRLFFADTDDDTKWNLNVNSLVEALSTAAHGAGFPQQIFLIDACANGFYQSLAQTIQGEVAEVKFAASGEFGPSEQFVFFASPDYGVATNDANAGTGQFSQAVLEELKGQSLLPDMKAIAERIQADFLKNQKIRPVYWLKLGDDQIDVSARMSPKNLAVNSSQIRKLQWLQRKRTNLEQQLDDVQSEIEATPDVTIRGTYENRLNLLFKQIEQVDHDIQVIQGGK
ncbi:MAG: caspase family protein [Stenomitos rutilans HA7619-LM2]|jgi:hypothetical protein|nr:caspase family protein [Stenomitos rutilans HA7619-LM2]